MFSTLQEKDISVPGKTGKRPRPGIQAISSFLATIRRIFLSLTPQGNHATMWREVCFERVSESEVLLRAGEGNNPSSFHLFGEQENTRQGNNAHRARGSKDARGEVISGKDQVLLSCLVRPTNDELLKRSSRIEPCVLVRMFRFKARKRKNELKLSLGKCF